MHRLFQDGPILMFQNQGDFLHQEAVAATRLYSKIIQEHGYLLLLLDFSHSGGVEPKTRRHLVDWGKQNAAQICIAVFGSNVVFRTTFTLVINAIRLIGSSAIRAKACADPSEALAWLKSCGASYINS